MHLRCHCASNNDLVHNKGHSLYKPVCIAKESSESGRSFVLSSTWGKSMNRFLRLHFLFPLCALCVLAVPAFAQSLEPRWQKDFPKEVSWYVRTSPGILLVRAGKSLTALDALDGRQLWALPDLDLSGGMLLEDSTGAFFRMTNVLEVPRTGVLLLHHAKLPGDSQSRVIALNLVTGERLWDWPSGDHPVTALPLPGTPHAVLVATRVQRKVRVAEIAAAIALTYVSPYMPLIILPVPYRFEFQRFDSLTGNVVWNSEFPRTFNSGTVSVATLGDHLFLDAGNDFLASISPADGNRLWEEGAKKLALGRPSLPLLLANGRLVYTLNHVRAVDAGTEDLAWEIRGLGRVTGIIAAGPLVAAIGDSHLAAVDAATGKELWRRETYGHTTNLLWDKASDGLLYSDGKGLHSVARTTGNSLLDAPLHAEGHPELISLAGQEVLVTISSFEISAYNFRTGKKLFDAGKPAGFFSSFAPLMQTLLPGEGEGFTPWSTSSAEGGDPTGVVEGSLLTAEWQSRLAGFPGSPNNATDAYETASETGFQKVWWIDPKTNQKLEVGVAGTQHDVSLSLGMVFAVQGKQVWGAAIKTK